MQVGSGIGSFNLKSYAWGVTCELREALKGLKGEKGKGDDRV